MTTPRLQNKVALITGASRGIGAAVAKRFAQEGAQVILLARTLKDLESQDDELRAMRAEPLLVPFDLKDFLRIGDLAKALFEKYGGLDILVGNAGILGGLYPTQDIPPTVFHNVMTVNFMANWHLIRAFDGMLKNSTQGRAIFTTTGLTQKALPYWSAYVSSKSALEKMVLTYANEVKLTNLKVNLVDPGQVRTKLHADAMPGIDQNTIPHPDTITESFVVLAEDSCPHHGEIIRAQG